MLEEQMWREMPMPFSHLDSVSKVRIPAFRHVAHIVIEFAVATQLNARTVWFTVNTD